MQAKGLIRFFGIALALVCLYYLSFTLFTNSIENKAEKYAQAQTANDANLSEEDQREKFRLAERRYLDSVRNKKVVNLGIAKYTYQEVKEKQLNLGLDLQGGMSAVLQVSLEDLIRSMAGGFEDESVESAINRAKELQSKSEDDFVTLFGRAFEEVNPDKQLAAVFSNDEYQDRISFNATNDEVLAVIREEAKSAVQRTFEILRSRIDRFGVASPNINLLEATNRIVVELPGVDDRTRVSKLLESTAQLEFWETYVNSPELTQYIVAANDAAKIIEGVDDEPEDTDTLLEEDVDEAVAEDNLDTTEDTEIDLLEDGTAANDESTENAEEVLRKNPFFAVFQQAQQAGGVVGYVNALDTAKFSSYMRNDEILAAFPDNMKLLLDAKPFEGEDGNSFFAVYAIQSRFSDFEAPLSGDVITDARQDFDQNQNVVVSMTMNRDGARAWSKLTGENVGKNVAIVLDDRVYSAPTVNQQINGGNSQITGQFSIAEAQDLANILKAGKLPAPARIVEEAIVGPSLGQKSITAGLWSLVVGIVLVLLFMIFYYSSAGIIANIALLLNLFFVIGILASLGATLTLPGMAGIVLTIGMAVDANVIIFERIREELAKGSSLRKAIADGYTKSYSAIIDANLTTLITAAILYYVGLGPVLGFATVLIIGIFSSLFTAVLLTHLITDWWTGKDRNLSYANNISRGRFQNLNFDFFSKRKLAATISTAVIAIGLLSILFRGFELGVDFEGGRTYVVQFNQDVATSDVRNELTAPLEAAPLVRTYGASNQVKITTNYLIDGTGADTDEQVARQVYAGLNKFLGNDVSFEQFTDNYIQSSQKVGPSIADDIRRGAIWATLFALLGIFLYLLFRFKGWHYGAAAVATVAHDTLVLLGVFSIFNGILPFSLEIDQTFIAALLTVIGYSINDTVVVFDRIREYINLNPRSPFRATVNSAVNDTLSRTIITSLTTLIVVAILFIFGGEVIRGFSFALLLGIIVGTYSSIFVATPIMAELYERYIQTDNTLAANKRNTKAKKPVKRKTVKS